MFKKLFGKRKNLEIDFDKVDLNLSEQGKDSIKKFSSRKDDERMGDIISLGDKGNKNFFYLIYYAALYDANKNVRFAALKRIPNFRDSLNFDRLIENLGKPGVGENLEPYYSMMLLRLGRITKKEFNNKLNNESTKKELKEPFSSLDNAINYIRDEFKNETETLLIADELNDSTE